MIRKLAIVLVMVLCPNGILWASDSKEGEIQYLLLQMGAVINSRNPDKIKDFFNYYASKDAKFVKHSSLLDPSNLSVAKTQETNFMTRDEYIKYLLHILKSPDQYAFWLNQNSFRTDKKKQYATVGASIKEVEISPIKSKKSRETIYVKISVSANCNFSFNIEPSIPTLEGMSCMEKIIIE